MKLDRAKAVLEAAGARKRVRAAEAEKRAATLSQKLRNARAREAPRRRYMGPEIIKAAMLAGEGRSASEIAEALGGTTSRRVAALCAEFQIALVAKKKTEACVRVTLPRTTIETLSRLAVDRDVTVEVLAAEALIALAAEPTVLANLLDDEA